MNMLKNSIKKLLLLLVFSAGIFLFADEENNGTFYKVDHPNIQKGLHGIALRLTIPNTSFNYTPAKTKEGVLSDLAMSAYAVSHDNSTLALAESIPQEDGSYLNRIIFFEYGKFKILNGTEFKSDGKITAMFFFFDKLFLASTGKTDKIQAVVLNKNLPIFPNTLTLSAPVSSICQDKIFFYVKLKDKKLMQIDDAMRINATIETRHDGGLLFTLPKNNIVVNFTKENIENINATEDGLFKSTHFLMKDIPEPEQVFFPFSKTNVFYFASGDELYKVINNKHYEKVKISSFNKIILHPFKKVFYLLSNKRHMLEIIRPSDLKLIKRISHHSMQPVTYKFVKFIIPLRDGAVLITQNGEFVQLLERKRRFYKFKIR